jgi:uncharacterized damage-inducible protein DinB
MITPAYCQTMARYNAWQNQSLFVAANGLSEAERELDRGAFWGGIRATLSHLMWGDTIWIARFDGGPGPDAQMKQSSGAYDWATLWAERPRLDARIASWAWMVDASDLEGDLSWYSVGAGRDMSMSRQACVVHFFNHQTHHRGQVHAMLTAAGARPDDTDLPFLPDEVPEWR